MRENNTSAWPFAEITDSEGLDIESIFGKPSNDANQENPFEAGAAAPAAALVAAQENAPAVSCSPAPVSAPATPQVSQIGLIGGSGMINGLIECDTPHIIKGRIVKVVRTESEEKFSACGKHVGSEVTETISNKMIFNVLTPNGFKALT